MKEYKSKEGGRHLFNDDIHNLQDFIASITEMFRNSGQSFVINGCNVTVANSAGQGTVVTVSEGYVWLGNKVRHVAAREMVGVTLPVYIDAVDIQGPQLTYADNTTGVGSEEYVDYTASVKTNTENRSNVYLVSGGSDSQFPQLSNQFPSLRTAFFNQYSLVKNTNTEQKVTSATRFEGNLNMAKPTIYNPTNQQQSASFTVDVNGNLFVRLLSGYALVFEKATGILSLRNGANSIIWKIGTGTTISSGLNLQIVPIAVSAVPTATTLSYEDENGNQQSFRQGMMAMYGSGASTQFYILRGIVNGQAQWSRVTTEDDPDYEAYMVHK